MLHLRRICHILLTKWQISFEIILSDKYASGEASQDNCEVYLSFCESNDFGPFYMGVKDTACSKIFG
jgi:hypothetical protein